jgi:hypothetical protein
MADFEVRGAHELQALAERLKEAGEGELRKELLREIRGSAKKAIPDVRQSAYRTLPKRGGLAERVGKQAYAVQTRLSGSSASVRIVGKGMKELRDIDAGRLRHPVFGDREKWKAQSVTPGFFSGAIERRAPSIRRDIEKAMGNIAHKVTGGFFG